MNLCNRNHQYPQYSTFLSLPIAFSCLLMLIQLTTSQVVQAAVGNRCVIDECPITDKDAKNIDREAIRQANRNKALQGISKPGVKLFLWGVEIPYSLRTYQRTKEQLTDEINEAIVPRLNTGLEIPKTPPFKDEFETSQAFELRLKEYDKQYEEQKAQRKRELDQELAKIYAEEFNNVLGMPQLSKVNYDADHEEFTLEITPENADYKVIAKVKTPLADAKETKVKLAGLKAWVVFQIEGEKVIPVSVILQNLDGNPSLVKRLDFVNAQSAQSFSVGPNAYTEIRAKTELAEEKAKQEQQKEAAQKLQSEESAELERIKSSGHTAGTLGHDITRYIKLYVLYDNFGENPTCVISIQAYDPKVGLVHPNWNLRVQLDKNNKFVWGKSPLESSELRLRFDNNKEQFKINSRMQSGGIGSQLNEEIKELFLSSKMAILNAGMLGDETVSYTYDLTKFDKAYRFASAICLN